MSKKTTTDKPADQAPTQQATDAMRITNLSLLVNALRQQRNDALDSLANANAQIQALAGTLDQQQSMHKAELAARDAQIANLTPP